MIRIAFTAEDLGHWTGGTNYLRSLIHAVTGTGSGDIDVNVYMGTRASDSFSGPGLALSVRRFGVLDRKSIPWMVDRISTRLGGRPWLTNRRLLRDGITVHSHALPSRDSRLKSIGWIPDFQHVHLPHLFSPAQRAARDATFRSIAEHSDRVIVSSEDARNDCLRFAPAAEKRIRVLRFAALPQNAFACSRAELEQTYGIDRPYFYVPNQLWAHKNHATLIESVRLAAASLPSLLIICSGSTHDFRNPGHFAELNAAIAAAGIERNIRFLGLVPYEHIAPLMVHAMAVMNPSLFEGWSTTVEEAKALGLPMILSDIAVHREQASDARFFPPRSAEALAQLLIDVPASAFPLRSASALETAIAVHRARIEAFGKDFCTIVRELGDGARK